MAHRRLAFADADRQRALAIEHDFLRVVLDAPRLEQLGQVRRLVGHHRRHRVLRIGAAGRRVRRSDRRTRADGRRAARTGRSRTAHRRTAAWDARRRARRCPCRSLEIRGVERLASRTAASTAGRSPTASRIWRVCGSKPAAIGRPESRPTTGFFGDAELVDQLGDVVFEERFLVRIARTESPPGRWSSSCRRGRRRSSRPPRRPARTAGRSSPRDPRPRRTAADRSASSLILPPERDAISSSISRTRV